MVEFTLPSPAGDIKVFKTNTVVVGTGAAGYHAAERLHDFGVKDLVVVTDYRKAGTSRNTGSDKQTYYKLTLAGDHGDSVLEMAQTLFDGQCMDGDLALCEAALSVQCFLHLADLGVPFPQNRWGEYVGYKTDHDPRQRATSVGPYTSKMMTEKLEARVNEKGISVLDAMQVIKILTDESGVRGILCLNLEEAKKGCLSYTAFCCRNLVYATGGPAGMYANSVYPQSQFGASGLAFEAGVQGRNLTEWQFGLSSVAPRWNVSGTYMQVLPQFISTDANGEDPQEFLFSFFSSTEELLNLVFLKGYQWPFDVRKVQDGSSIIDLLVYEQLQKGRRVFLDYRANPGNSSIDYSLLHEEVRTYLTQAGACFGTPIERLCHMNQPAVDFYRQRGVDLAKERLEISLCAQHNNGGLAVDSWWQTCVSGLFAVGEAAGTHGVYRPGGSALNSGQVGSLRAARYISVLRQDPPQADEVYRTILTKAVSALYSLAQLSLTGNGIPVQQAWDLHAAEMSANAGAIRSLKGIQTTRSHAEARLETLSSSVRVDSVQELHKLYRLRDMLISQQTYLSAMEDYLQHGGKSRGSALYIDETAAPAHKQLSALSRFTLDDGSQRDRLQEVTRTPYGCTAAWRFVHEIPVEDNFFENVWRSYRENRNVW